MFHVLPFSGRQPTCVCDLFAGIMGILQSIPMSMLYRFLVIHIYTFWVRDLFFYMFFLNIRRTPYRRRSFWFFLSFLGVSLLLILRLELSVFVLFFLFKYEIPCNINSILYTVYLFHTFLFLGLYLFLVFVFFLVFWWIQLKKYRFKKTRAKRLCFFLQGV